MSTKLLHKHDVYLKAIVNVSFVDISYIFNVIYKRSHAVSFLKLKNENYAIGLMSGTSVDGIDAVLVKISGNYTSTKVEQKCFITLAYEDAVRERILKVAEGNFGGSKEICALNFLLGELFADACEELCEKANVPISQIDFVASHGQTVYHIPQKQDYLGKSLSSTLQIGEASIIAQRLNCPVVSDFRVRDVAAGGFGAPLVPYTEFLLYRQSDETIALQNIGGIGNITILPKNCALDDVIAFDTGVGNMVIDALVFKITKGEKRYDESGNLAKTGSVNNELLKYMLDDEYLKMPLPKTTGREYYGEQYVNDLCEKAQNLGINLIDVLATATMFTAKSIAIGIDDFCKNRPSKLIIGGGGSYNLTLLNNIKQCLPDITVLTNEDLGHSSDAKEAIAFAVLANETLHGNTNNAPSATGAKQAIIMGKISL